MDIGQHINRANSAISKPITPGIHAALDYATAAYFFGLAAGLWRRNLAGGIGALVNGAVVLGASLMTDYPGGGWKRISFPTHGKVDAIQTAMAAAVPVSGAFADEGDAWFFFGQCVSQAAIIAMTDWQQPRWRRTQRQAA